MCRAVPGVTPVPGVHSYRHEADGVCALGRGMPYVPWGRSLEIGMAGGGGRQSRLKIGAGSRHPQALLSQPPPSALPSVAL